MPTLDVYVNATQKPELRIATTRDSKLVEFKTEQLRTEPSTTSDEIESAVPRRTLNNIYKGTVRSVELDHDRAWIDIGQERDAIISLSLQNVSEDAYVGEHPLVQLRKSIKAGKILLVRVTKDQRENKGAEVTTQMSIAGRTAVLLPGRGHVLQVSKQLSSIRTKILNTVKKFELPENCGLIVRSAASRERPKVWKEDIENISNIWLRIQAAFKDRQVRSPRLLYDDHSFTARFVREIRNGTKQILIDDLELYQEIREFADNSNLEIRDRIKHYKSKTPLFSRYHIEDEIVKLFQRTVDLPSGGSIVIDPTEALTAIDVNSRSTRVTTDRDKALLNTNLEAAEVAAEQIIARNLCGLFVIDFIDMHREGYKEKVEQHLQKQFSDDAANVSFSTISEFGMLEMQRQRRDRTVYDLYFDNCPHCQGIGLKRHLPSAASEIVHQVEIGIQRGPTRFVEIEVPEDLSTYLSSKMRSVLNDIEQKNNTKIQTTISSYDSLVDGQIRFYNGEPSNPRTSTYVLQYRNVMNITRKRFNDTTSLDEEHEDAVVSYDVRTDNPDPSKVQQKKRQSKQRRSRRRRGSFGTWLLGLFGLQRKRKKTKRPPQRARKAPQSTQAKTQSKSQKTKQSSVRPNQSQRNRTKSSEARTNKPRQPRQPRRVNSQERQATPRHQKREHLASKRSSDGKSSGSAPTEPTRSDSTERNRSKQSQQQRQQQRSKQRGDEVATTSDETVHSPANSSKPEAKVRSDSNDPRTGGRARRQKTPAAARTNDDKLNTPGTRDAVKSEQDQRAATRDEKKLKGSEQDLERPSPKSDGEAAKQRNPVADQQANTVDLKKSPKRSDSINPTDDAKPQERRAEAKTSAAASGNQDSEPAPRRALNDPRART